MVGMGLDANRRYELTYYYTRTIFDKCCSCLQALLALFQKVTQGAGDVVQHVDL